MTAYKIGFEIGNFIRGVIKIALAIALFAVVAQGMANVGEKEIAKSHVVKKKHHKRHYKKCACECKKVVDNARKVDYNNFIGPRD